MGNYSVGYGFTLTTIDEVLALSSMFCPFLTKYSKTLFTK